MHKSPDHQSIRYPVLEKDDTITQIDSTPTELIVVWGDGHSSRFNRFWLRDNCPSAGDKTSAIRSFHLREMGQHTLIESVFQCDHNSVCVAWQNEDHTSQFKTKWLRHHCYEADSRGQRKRRPVLWGLSLQQQIPTARYQHLKVDNKQHLELLERLVNYGVVRVQGLPQEKEGIELLEPLLAPFTENDFGRVFDLISEPDVWDLSQSNEALDPHSDDPYRYHPPGIRILCCVEASPEGGGRSVITNALAAAESLRREQPQAFKLLANTSIPYIRYREDPVPQGADVHLRTHAPIIAVDAEGDVVGVRYHERSMATFDLPPSIVERYYLALIEYSKLINSGEFSLKYLLKPGDAFIFDNQQVLHGRETFKGASGRRHLTLCQMSRDLVHSRYRLLLSKHGRYGAADVFAKGV